MHLGIYPKKKEKKKGDTFKYWLLSTESNTKGISIVKTFKKQKATFIHSKVSQYYLFYCLHQTNTKKKIKVISLCTCHFSCLSLSNYAIFYTYKTLLHTFFFFQENISNSSLTLNQPIIWIKFINIYISFLLYVTNIFFYSILFFSPFPS